MNRWLVRGVILATTAAVWPGVALAQDDSVDQAREALARQEGDEDASAALVMARARQELAEAEEGAAHTDGRLAEPRARMFLPPLVILQRVRQSELDHGRHPLLRHAPHQPARRRGGACCRSRR